MRAHCSRRSAGQTAPEAWRGALPLTYRLGPGPATVHLKLEFDFAQKPLYDVIATLVGPRAARPVGHPRQPSRRMGQRRGAIR